MTMYNGIAAPLTCPGLIYPWDSTGQGSLAITGWWWNLGVNVGRDRRREVVVAGCSGRRDGVRCG